MSYNIEKFSYGRVGRQRTVYYEITLQKSNPLKTFSPHSVSKAPLILNLFFKEKWPLYVLYLLAVVPKKCEPDFTDSFNIW